MAVECTYCEEKVNAKRGIYIKCSTCQDIKLCLECFSAGATIAEHESDHPYELVDCGSFPIIDESWKAYEELALLEAIELYGIGSWTDIANAVETRSAEECCDRYLRIYVDNFFGRCSWNAIEKDLYHVHDHTCTHNQPLSPSLSLPEKHKIVEIDKDQQLRLGYMPKRDDFEREYDNDAELCVSKLAVNANDDSELDQDLKIAHINMYTDRLRERFRRKRIVLEYNLVKLFFHMHPEECGDPSLDNNQLKPPESYTQSAPSASKTTNTAIQTGLTPTQNRNSTSIATTAQSNSITHHKDTSTSTSTKTTSPKPISKNNSTSSNPPDQTNGKDNTQPIQTSILKYFQRVDAANASAKSSTSDQPDNSILSSYFSDLNKSIAEQDFNTMEKKLRIFCQFSSSEDHNRLIRNIAREKELKVKIKDLIRKRKNGQRFHNQVANNNSSQLSNGNESDTNSKQSPSKKNPTKNSISKDVDEPMDVDSDDTNTATFSPSKVGSQKKTSNNKNESSNNNTNNKPITAYLSTNSNPEAGWRLLNLSEKRFCKSCNLTPSKYMSYKAFLIKEQNQRKKKGASQKLFTDDIDKTVRRKMVDFLSRKNWIKV